MKEDKFSTLEENKQSEERYITRINHLGEEIKRANPNFY